MKKRYFIPLLFVLLITSVCITACGNKTTYDKGEWAKIESVYGEQGFSCVPEEGITIDGYLDEDAWNEKCKKVFTHTELGVSFAIRSYFNETGMYFGMISRDYNVIYSRAYGLQQSVNSGFVLSVIRDDDKQMTRKFSVGMDAGNTPRAYGLYNYLGRATVQGVINSGETDGMTAELFVPWSNIGLDVKSTDDVPENVRVFVRYNVINGDVGTVGASIYPGLGNDSNFGKMYNFDKDGYKDADEGSWLLGDAADGYAKSTDYDFSRASEGVYGTDASGDRTLSPNYKTIFVRNMYSKRFVYTVRIRPDLENGTAILGDGSRSTVNLMAQTSYGMYGFGVSLLPGSVNSNTVRITRVSCVNHVWNDATSYEWSAFYTTQCKDFKNDGVTLTLVKDGDTYYYIYGTLENGKFIGYDRNVIHSGAACPGIITGNSAALLSDIKCTTYGDTAADDAAIAAILNRVGAYRVRATANIGGTATFNKDVVERGEQPVLTFRNAGGNYLIQKVEMSVGGGAVADITDVVRAGMSLGKYVLDSPAGDVDVNVTFAQAVDTHTATLDITLPVGVAQTTLTVSAEGTTDKLLYYETRTGTTRVAMQLPAGEYNFRITAAGLKVALFTLDLGTQDATQNVTMAKADFGGSVTVGGKKLDSSAAWECYDPANADGTAYDADTKSAFRAANLSQSAVIWMNDVQSGNLAFEVNYEVTASTDADPNGGFIVCDGTNTYYVFVLRNGVRVINTSNGKGWQVRNDDTAFAKAIGGSVVGKKIALSLVRTGTSWTFTATYNGATLTQSLDGMTESWGSNASGQAFTLPTTGAVAVGLAATDISVMFTDISLG